MRCPTISILSLERSMRHKAYQLRRASCMFFRVSADPITAQPLRSDEDTSPIRKSHRSGAERACRPSCYVPPRFPTLFSALTELTISDLFDCASAVDMSLSKTVQDPMPSYVESR